jgi:hypothetical protein
MTCPDTGHRLWTRDSSAIVRRAVGSGFPRRITAGVLGWYAASGVVD